MKNIMAMCKESNVGSSSALKCSICLSDSSRPKLLPCLHTVCLNCRKKYCEDVIDDDKSIICPLCKVVPTQGGVENFSNYELRRRLMLEERFCGGKQEDITYYEPCNDVQEGIEASCIVSTMEDQTKAKVSTTENQTKDKRLKFMWKYCSKHHNNEIKLYCYDCNLLICRACCATNHSTHMYKELYKISNERKRPVQQCNGGNLKCTCSEGLDLGKLSNEHNNSLLVSLDDESDIRKSFPLKVHLLNTQEELKDGEDRVIHIDSQKDIVRLCNTELKSFLNCREMALEQRAEFEIIHSVNNLNERAEESTKAKNKHHREELSFMQADTEQSELNEAEKGTVQEVGLLDKFLTVIKLYSPSVDSIRKLARPFIDSWLTGVRVRYMYDVIRHKTEVSGVTVVDDEIFVVRYTYSHSHVTVYKSLTLTASRNINIPDFQLPTGIAGCAYNRALYICDARFKCSFVHRVDLTNDSITHWTLKKNYEPWNLSVTAEHTVLITVSYMGMDKGRLWEYTTEGQQLREIKLEESIQKTWQGVKLSSNRFIVGHGHSSGQNRVCMVNAEGRIVKSYGREQGGGKGQLSVPLQVAIDYRPSSQKVFVADCGNCRVLKFDTDLSYIGQIYTPYDLEKHFSFCFDPSTDKLIIGEHSGRVLVFSSQ